MYMYVHSVDMKKGGNSHQQIKTTNSRDYLKQAFLKHYDTCIMDLSLSLV